MKLIRNDFILKKKKKGKSIFIIFNYYIYEQFRRLYAIKNESTNLQSVFQETSSNAIFRIALRLTFDSCVANSVIASNTYGMSHSSHKDIYSLFKN